MREHRGSSLEKGVFSPTSAPRDVPGISRTEEFALHPCTAQTSGLSSPTGWSSDTPGLLLLMRLE